MLYYNNIDFIIIQLYIGIEEESKQYIKSFSWIMKSILL
jgi:hypothetical protein